MARLFLSDQLEILADNLADELRSKRVSPLSIQTLLLPNQKLKSWLTLFLAKRGIVAGYRFQSAEEVCRNSLSPSPIEMMGSIYTRIKEGQIGEISSYLQGKEKRAIELADHLSTLFFSYVKFGLEKSDHWQSKLFHSLPWRHERKLHAKGVIHCFGCDFLPEATWDCLLKQEINVYLFSPCLHFWEDLCTHWEKKKLLRKGSEQSRTQLESYLSDAPPLLANWGKLGRETLKILDRYEFEIEERYSDGAFGIKRSLLHMEPYEPSDQDLLIEVFQTGSSPLREVEILKETIERLAREGTPFSEMLVLAPDINRYVPLIELVFGDEIPYRIHDVETDSKSHFLKGIKEFLCREEIFQNPSYYKKRNWGPKELEKVAQWLKTGLDRVCDGLLYLNETEISWSEADLLEELVEQVQSLQNDFPSGEMSCAEWAGYLEKIGKKYFVIDSMGEAPFESLLLELRKSRLQEKFPIEFIIHWLDRSSSGTIHPSSLHAIRFGSLQAGSLTSARALFLIGMDEEHFPRRESSSSLDLLKKQSGFIPRAGDVDRYLMLQALFTAQKYLYFSFGHLSGDEGKPIGPSLALQELLSELKRDELKTAPPLITPSKSQKTDFFKLDLPFPELPKGEVTVLLSDLVKLARHPWEFYLQKVLGISLERKEIEAFAAQKSWFAKESLKGPLEESLRELFPPGLIGKAQQLEIDKTVEEWQDQLKEWKIEPATWSLMETCREKKIVSPKLVEVPSLELQLNETLRVKIIGDLKMMSEQGLISTTDQILRIWPEALVGALVSGNPHLFLLKKEKSALIVKPREALSAYLIYYFRALSHLPPLEMKSRFEDQAADWIERNGVIPTEEELRDKWKWLEETFAYAEI